VTQAIVLSPARPEPRSDEISGPFFEALRQHRFVVQACAACGTRQLARWRCLSCGGERLEWVAASGRGMLHSFAIVRANGNPHFNQGEPYNIAVVELAEGPQIYTNIVQAEPAELKIGMAVQVVYLRLESGAVAPVFEPA